MRLLTVAVALFLTHQSAVGGTISVITEGTSDHPAIILIKGVFSKDDKFADIATFQTIASAQKNGAVIFLDSQGGSTWSAMHIGKIIRKRGFSTAVANDAQCASSCALIWLAGKERFMGHATRLGFHAARAPDKPNEPPAVSSAGNAMVGAYMYEMGITDLKTIALLTSAQPQNMTWLILSDMERLKIDAKEFAFTQGHRLWAAREMSARDPYPQMLRADMGEPPQPQPAVGLPPARADIPNPPTLDSLQEADARIQKGDVAGARNILAPLEGAPLRESIEQGRALLLLAKTYDPNMLAAWKARGLSADVARTRALYLKALSRGAGEAMVRLDLLQLN
jgi:hypothetical protein